MTEENSRPAEEHNSKEETAEEQKNAVPDQQQEKFEDREVEIDDPQEIINKLQEELAQAKQDYLRALADVDNHQKRALKERSELLKYQGERLIVDLLEVVDSYDLALGQEDQSKEALEEGMKAISQQLQQILDKWEVKAETAQGEKFNPKTHDALSMVPSPDHEAGTVIQELKKAYYYKDKLVRAGQVIVAQEAKSEESES